MSSLPRGWVDSRVDCYGNVHEQAASTYHRHACELLPRDMREAIRQTLLAYCDEHIVPGLDAEAAWLLREHIYWQAKAGVMDYDEREALLQRVREA